MNDIVRLCFICLSDVWLWCPFTMDLLYAKIEIESVNESVALDMVESSKVMLSF